VLQCESLYLPWYFLKKLMMVNVTARNVKYPSESETTELDLDHSFKSSKKDDMLNPLDIITALFLCSDGFVQQELALKMSMCQFSVPLLLPNCDTNQSTLMLWAMRDIVKKYRPLSLSESKGFIEERIVLSELPMVSFVRLGECSLSKSEILNKLLSNSQQYHDTFVHHNMECGDAPRRISNGLTEISWYLPCGNRNMDIFSEPVAIANLRGDIASFETQYSFLCQTSAAVFVFFDQLDPECELLTNKNHKAQIFLVGNHQSKNFSSDAVKKVQNKLSLTKNNIITKKKQTNDADFFKCLRKMVSNVVDKTTIKMSIEEMAAIAHDLGILVDEDSSECQAGKKNADAITAEIQDILKSKKDQLPLQVESENIETYRSDLKEQKKGLRRKQNNYKMSDAVKDFINAISSQGTERRYFLKWMRMNLDNLSCIKLSGLRELYKEKSQNSENKEEIKEIDKQLSNSSLGIEHFFREMGQIYEASLSLPETDPSRQQLQHLPKLCAQLLLDGFPLELVDGDASNIPLRWVSDVLSQLNDLVSPKNKILVATVLGVQSTGKSTLLNTMFGVQFAVSSGRCTRGAFMLLIKVNEDVKKDLNCDFMMIIDTEGLKSPELAQLDNSHEHDNELATLVVGLSDITIINIAMENSTEMKDILQIVVHAFLRMKEVGKKPKCQFVHQNVSDVSAHENNLRDRKLLLQQLNEMTQAAAKMEKKEENKSFTDVMEYNPDTGNCYIPGLWNGNPPMAPVNAGYSEAVYELKKNIIQQLGTCELTSNNILEFREWMSSLWTAVKHENFIFSFRNSLVADAYMKLCAEFNKWEWEFKKAMYTWVTNAETRISNFGTIATKSELSDLREFITQLKSEAITELSEWETKLLNNLIEYFKQTEGHVYLVEKYREEFSNSIKSLRREMQSSVVNQLTAAADIKQGMKELDKIRANYTKEIEKAVCELIDECRKKKVQMTDSELDEEFNKMWTETVNRMSFTEMKPINVFDSVSHFSTICEFEDRHVQTSIDNINDAIKTAKAETTDSLKTFVENICKELGDKLVISQDALGAFMILNNADQEQFAHWLTESVKEIKEALSEKLKNTTIETKLKHLQMNPLNELFNRVIGCRKQCPFCKVPCDAGGGKHTEHFASLHRPEGIGRRRWDGSDKLVTDICSSSVISDKRFRCFETKNKWHPFKKYRKVFPDWDIPPDRSLEASDFWKYVMTKYNNEFAEAYGARPADIPASWRNITEEQAKESLKDSFNWRRESHC
uniref:Si:dkey-85k7.12 n=1 Tax=Kryptolebias marmoratus TaxID=37003 RepID=A0A3Q2ZK51_KRYMA